MKLEHSVRYAASLADVHSMLTDPAFREKAGGKHESLIGGKLKTGWDIEHGVGVARLAGDR